ncbi:uncharacterized protein BX663DRAFT_523303 [Cokeromyces recurvatus]|uniref:uncharacterized protein n=1 Tax=Cokeromyces recurvatus TaxID=90255 RepID=UPI00221EF4A8|nr:uncharacterized protein BX663DRAFT_523303 [Cokeromyces recurvatus]KAI7898938.1 hypothetical protein BX663DRAFT_523303 [Cokeromyces recurvatus]
MFVRTPIAIALACIAAVFTVEAAPTNCLKTYKVVASDTCYDIAMKNHITTTKLRSLNSSINSKCSNLKMGQKLCVSVSNSVSNKKTTTKKKADSKKKTTTKKKTGSKKKTTTATTTKKKTTTTKKSTKKPTTDSSAPTASPPNIANYGLTAQITSSSDFCLFLPNSPGGKADNKGKVDVEAISKSEKNAVAFCLKPSAKAPGARTLPVNFIKTAHFYKNTTAGYIQVTGKFNPAAYELSTKDEGGQYDDHGKGSPPNSICYGYKYYVNLIEPSNPDYCIRCCNTYEDCHAGRSTYGCKRVVSNGIYV